MRKRWRAARILYIEGYLWDEESAKQASRKAIAAVKGAGGRIALSLSDSFCVGRFRERVPASAGPRREHPVRQ